MRMTARREFEDAGRFSVVEGARVRRPSQNAPTINQKKKHATKITTSYLQTKFCFVHCSFPNLLFPVFTSITLFISFVSIFESGGPHFFQININYNIPSFVVIISSNHSNDESGKFTTNYIVVIIDQK